MKKFVLLLTLIILSACDSGLTRHGTNPQDIDEILDLATCKPRAIEYDYAQSHRGGLGPTDYTVQAILYYDAATFARFREKYGNERANDSQVTKATFNYTWLPRMAKNELAASPEPYVYSGAQLSRYGNPHCYLWILNNKVIVYYFTM